MSLAHYAAAALLAIGCASAPADILPNHDLTPGWVFLNAGTTQICKKGYAGKVRNVPQSEKNQVYKEYGLKNGHDKYCGKKGCEIDHLVSLELGGSNDIKNLWPEPYDGPMNAHEKDKVENATHRAVCSGKMSLADAQRQIASDWTVLYKQFGFAKSK